MRPHSRLGVAALQRHPESIAQQHLCYTFGGRNDETGLSPVVRNNRIPALCKGVPSSSTWLHEPHRAGHPPAKSRQYVAEITRIERAPSRCGTSQAACATSSNRPPCYSRCLSMRYATLGSVYALTQNWRRKYSFCASSSPYTKNARSNPGVLPMRLDSSWYGVGVRLLLGTGPSQCCLRYTATPSPMGRPDASGRSGWVSGVHALRAIQADSPCMVESHRVTTIRALHLRRIERGTSHV